MITGGTVSAASGDSPSFNQCGIGGGGLGQGTVDVTISGGSIIANRIGIGNLNARVTEPAGAADITLTYEDGVTGDMRVEVTEYYAGTVTLAKSFRDIAGGEASAVLRAAGVYDTMDDPQCFLRGAATLLVPAASRQICPDCGADLFDIRYCPSCFRCESCTTICRDCGQRCILCDPGFNEDTGRCSVCDSMPLGPGDPGNTGVPTVIITDEGRSARVDGEFDGMYIRIALVIRFKGESGLFVTQGAIDDDGVIEIPKFDVPGLIVAGINVSLVSDTDSILSPEPVIIAAASIMFQSAPID